MYLHQESPPICQQCWHPLLSPLGNICVVPLSSPWTGAKELPEEYRGRKCPQYSQAANIGRCCPISIHKHFVEESGITCPVISGQARSLGRSKGMTGFREGDQRVKCQMWESPGWGNRSKAERPGSDLRTSSNQDHWTRLESCLGTSEHGSRAK